MMLLQSTAQEAAMVEDLLLQWSIGFGIKTVVFGVLFAIMFRQMAKTGFGRALTAHYLAVGFQSLVICVTFAQYWTAWGDGRDGFLTFDERIWLYRIGTLSVYLVALSGLLLIILYFTQGKPDGRAEPE